MKSQPIVIVMTLGLSVACGSAPTSGELGLAGGSGGSAGNGGSGGASSPPQAIGAVSPPKQLIESATSLLDVTSDDQIVFQDPTGVRAVSADGQGGAQTILDGSATVLTVANVVFAFANLDWTQNEGNLTFWTRTHGAVQVGPVHYSEQSLRVSASGFTVAYLVHTGASTQDLRVQSVDGSKPETLSTGIGRGASSCAPSFDFVGETLILGSCAPGANKAKLSRFTRSGKTWSETVIATESQADWSADLGGERLLFSSPNGGLTLWSPSASQAIDDGVGWAMITPDGSRAYYTVSDQLRTTTLPDVAPIPVVVNDYSVRVGFSPDFSQGLYSRKVDYQAGNRQDLLGFDGGDLNVSPRVLEAEPKALLGKSVFTRTGAHLMYFTAESDTERTLLIRRPDGTETQRVEGADTALAALGERVVFSANRSEPTKWPITADLRVVDARGGASKLLFENTTDGRNFFVTADGARVVFLDAAKGALMIQKVP